jgi:hypothetical protein
MKPRDSLQLFKVTPAIADKIFQMGFPLIAASYSARPASLPVTCELQG